MRTEANPQTPAAPEVPGDVLAAVVAVLGLLASGASHEQLKRRLDHIANHYAPQEVSQIYRMLGENATPEAVALIAGLAPQWQYLTTRKAREYQREVLTTGALLYRSAVQGAERGALVALAAGPKHSMFLANVRFLEMLGHLPIDVLILSNIWGPHGRWNMGGTGAPYVALQRVKALLAARGVQPRCYIGASAAGETALAAATLDRDCMGITLAGRFFTPGRSLALAQAPPAFLPMCACRPARAKLYALYNAGEPIDVDSHRLMRGLAPHARIYPIPDDSQHNPLVTLAARGKLRSLFAQIGEAAFGREPNFDGVCAP